MYSSFASVPETNHVQSSITSCWWNGEDEEVLEDDKVVLALAEEAD